MKLLLILSIVLFSYNLKAQYEESYETAPSNGIGLSPSLGYTLIEIENPDDTSAKYKGFALQLETSLPIYQGEFAKFNLLLHYKTSFVDNTSNNDSYSEEVKFSGPGAGLSFSYGKLGIGANYNLVSADHSTTTLYSQNTKYDFKTISYFLEYAKRHEEFSFGARFSYEAGDLEKSETGYSKDVGYTAYTAWIYFVYYTGFTLL